MPIVIPPWQKGFPGPVPPPSGGTATFPVPNGNSRASLWAENFTVPRPVMEFVVMRNDTHVNESPRYVTAGESLVWTVTFEGATTCSDPSLKAYQEGTDVTSTIFPSGNPSASGNVVTLPAATGFTGRTTLVVALTVTVDGSTRVVKLVVVVGAASDA